MKKSALLLFLTLSVLLSIAQVKVPPAGGNKKAVAAEQIGITDVTIKYNRPAVKGREGKIWGQLVHYGFADLHYGTSKAAPWRAGANENTTMEFSTDVLIEGKPLPAGKYGFFIAMGKEKATIIFSKDNNAWGSFFYVAANDALRVDVPVQTTGENVEWLKYEFSNQTDTSAVVSLLWEKIKIPFAVSIDLTTTQIAAYRFAINNGDFYRYWQNMERAANYCLVHNQNINEALGWADRSVNEYFGEANFQTLSTYAGLMEKANRQREADSLMKKALTMGNPTQLHMYALTLFHSKKTQAAFDIFKMNYDKSPKLLFTNVGMILAYASTGNKTEALKFVDKATPLANNNKNATNYLEELRAAIKEGKDISGM